MQKVLICGGFGFIGYHLARRLLESTEAQVFLYDNCIRGKLDSALQALNERFNRRVRVTTTQRSFGWWMEDYDFDVIFHLAALNGTRNFYERPYTVLANNCQATFSLLDLLKSSTFKTHIVYASSSEVYSGLPNPVPTPEDVPVGFTDPRNPRWSYGLSKLVGEVALVNAARQADHLSYTICRLHNIYGPRMGDGHVIPNLLQSLWSLTRDNPCWPVKNAADTRSFCYVVDCVEALVAAATSDVCKGETLNIGNPVETSIGELAELIYQYRVGGDWPIQQGGKVDAGSVDRRCPDITKITRLTGWAPKVSLEEGLRITVDWYRERYLAEWRRAS